MIGILVPPETMSHEKALDSVPIVDPCPWPDGYSPITLAIFCPCRCRTPPGPRIVLHTKPPGIVRQVGVTHPPNSTGLIGGYLLNRNRIAAAAQCRTAGAKCCASVPGGSMYRCPGIRRRIRNDCGCTSNRFFGLRGPPRLNPTRMVSHVKSATWVGTAGLLKSRSKTVLRCRRSVHSLRAVCCQQQRDGGRARCRCANSQRRQRLVNSGRHEAAAANPLFVPWHWWRLIADRIPPRFLALLAVPLKLAPAA